MNANRWLPRVALALLCAEAAATNRPALYVEADRDHVFLGQSVNLTVRVTGLPRPPEPDLSAIAGATVLPLGASDIGRRSVVMLNGRMEEQDFPGRIFRYEITPAEPGRLVAGPVRLALQPTPLEAEGPVIDVTGTETQDVVRVRLWTTRDTALVGEPFRVTVSVFLRKASGGGDLDPLDPREPPVLTIPHLDGRPIHGLRGPDVRDLLRPHLILRRDWSGLAVNNFTVRDEIFAIAPSIGEETARFRFPRHRPDVGGGDWFEYELSSVYVPTEEGRHTFGPVVFRGTVVTNVEVGAVLDGRRVFTSSPAQSVRVISPPEPDRPDVYIGAVGTNLAAEASLDAPTCRLGDPLRLSITVSGDVGLENVFPPVLTRQPAIARAFAVHDGMVRTERRDGAVTFLYTVRPTQPGVEQFPPVELAYYDLRGRAYRTVATKPIPVRVRDASEWTGAEEAAASPADRRLPAPALPAGLVTAPLKLGPKSADAVAIARPEHFLLAFAGPVCWALALAARRERRLAAARAVRRARRCTLKDARGRLRAARRAARRDPARASASLCGGLRALLATRFGLGESTMSAADVRDLARREPALAVPLQEAADLLERHADVAYSGRARAGPDVRRDAGAAIRLWRVLSRVSRRGRHAATAALAAAAWLAAWPGRAAGDDQARRFLWDEAHQRMALASTPADYLAAASTYRKLAAAGARSGALYYNLGTALLKAERYEEASAALARAERYLGADPEVRRNLQLAAEGDPDTAATRSPYRWLCPWHYAVPGPTRVGLAAAAFALLWISFAARALGHRALAARLLAAALAWLAIFGSSAVVTLYQEETAVAVETAGAER